MQTGKIFLSKIKPNLQKVDLVLISYNLFLQISYKDEIENKTNNIEKIIKLSKELNCVIVAGSNYDLFGKHYSSVLTADKGKLLGIADSVYPLSQKASGKELKIYKTKLGKLGIIVNEDIFNLKTAVLLKKFGAKFIINICDFFDIEKQNKAVLEVGKLADKSIF